MTQKITPQFVTTQFGAITDRAVEGQERFRLTGKENPPLSL